jgi:hypothetical protein
MANKTQTSKTTKAATKAAGPVNVTFTLPKGTNDRPANLIVPAGLMGSKERWFIKANLIGFTKAKDGTFTVTASERQAKERGITNYKVVGAKSAAPKAAKAQPETTPPAQE